MSKDWTKYVKKTPKNLVELSFSKDDMEVAMLKIALEFAQGSDRELLFVKISRNRR